MMINLKSLNLTTKYTFLISIALVSLWSCEQNNDVVFRTVSAEKTNINFKNQVTETEDVNILDYMYFYNGGGVAVGDINNDSLPDIFFSGNQVKNKLYLNQGNLKFKDISKSANVEGHSSWNTGAVMGDVNGDGLLDIYVCAVVGLNGFNGYNELYINNGDDTFTESAADYGLDFDTYSSSAAFLDYDKDGDLDLYLLNHATHTPESYGKVEVRYKRDYQTGDKLLRNDNGNFVDVSEEAGIFGGVNGYGLGISVADFNQDGYPDIYIGNDFHEDDYYYVNNGDGTFSNKLTSSFGHTSRFSMGSDASDINHDGLPDLLSLDMLPENEKVLKSSVDDEDYQLEKIRLENYGYYNQYSRNMLQINQKDGNFKEVGLMSGVAATDWSWSALFADYNQDGEQDLYITNGIIRRPNDLDYINFISNDQIRNKIDKTNLVDQKALSKMPSGKVANYIFKGNGDLTFENKSQSWVDNNKANVSTAMAIGDLDNDGDIDIVINNLNETAAILENQTNSKSRYLKINLQYPKPNTFAIGAKVYAYQNNKMQFKENYTCRGYQASSEPMIHFGFGNSKKIDSLKIIWPDNTYQVIKDLSTNQSITVKPNNTIPVESQNKEAETLFSKVEGNLGIDFTHIEDRYKDFARHKLIPYQLSNKGPGIAIGDLNNDGKQDIFFGGSKFKRSHVYIQEDSNYVSKAFHHILKDSINEEVSAVIDDFTNDAKNELFVGTAGNDFQPPSKPLLDRYYRLKDTVFMAENLPELYNNNSTLKPYDFDEDGDLDIFVGNYTITNDFGNIPDSYILVNENGKFSVLDPNPFEKLGMVTDAVWEDFDSDGVKDLIVVGEWMSPKFFKNNSKNFEEVDLLGDLNGLWQAIQPFDIDNDGDTDYILGNWGTNTKFSASEDYPIKMYYADFDHNGQTETILCTAKDGNYYPIAGLDELASQLVFLKKKFTSYKSFAGKTIDEVLNDNMIDKAKVLEVNQLKSGYLANDDGQYKFIAFNNTLQVAPLTSFLTYDFDSNGSNSVLVGGNYFGVTPYHGRLDAFSGALINNINSINLGPKIGLNFLKKDIRHLNIIKFDKKPYLMVTKNNSKVEIYKF